MNTLYYEKTLSEAKDYLNGLKQQDEKTSKTMMLLTNWMVGIVAFIIYNSSQTKFLYTLVILFIPILFYAYYLYRFSFVRR